MGGEIRKWVNSIMELVLILIGVETFIEVPRKGEEYDHSGTGDAESK